MSQNVFSKMTWVEIGREIDERGVHAEIIVDRNCLPLGWVIYNDFKNRAINARGDFKIKGIVRNQQEGSCNMRIRVYPYLGSDERFQDWTRKVKNAVLEALRHEVYQKVNMY